MPFPRHYNAPRTRGEQVGRIAAQGAAAFQVLEVNLRSCTGPFQLAYGHVLAYAPKKTDYLHDKKVFSSK